MHQCALCLCDVFQSPAYVSLERLPWSHHPLSRRYHYSSYDCTSLRLSLCLSLSMCVFVHLVPMHAEASTDVVCVLLPGHVTGRNPACAVGTHVLFLKHTAGRNGWRYHDEEMTNAWEICDGTIRMDAGFVCVAFLSAHSARMPESTWWPHVWWNNSEHTALIGNIREKTVHLPSQDFTTLCFWVHEGREPKTDGCPFLIRS